MVRIRGWKNSVGGAGFNAGRLLLDFSLSLYDKAIYYAGLLIPRDQ